MTQIVKMNRSNVLVLDTYRFTQKAKINVNHLCSYDIVNSDSQILIVIFPPIGNTNDLSNANRCYTIVTMHSFGYY